jgi:hypothetical protein
MRLWTLHPRYLDAKGLVALWREALLAQKVLQGATKGYLHHPQLRRFRASSDPEGAMAAYLIGILKEAEHRGYAFDAGRIAGRLFHDQIDETEGQLLFEWGHLHRKLQQRDPERRKVHGRIKIPKPHPLFRIFPGPVREWERGRK